MLLKDYDTHHKNSCITIYVSVSYMNMRHDYWKVFLFFETKATLHTRNTSVEKAIHKYRRLNPTNRALKIASNLNKFTCQFIGITTNPWEPKDTVDLTHPEMNFDDAWGEWRHAPRVVKHLAWLQRLAVNAITRPGPAGTKIIHYLHQ